MPQALLDRERVGVRQDQVRGVSVAKVVQSDAPETRALHVRVEHLAHAVNPESAAELEREAAQLPIPSSLETVLGPWIYIRLQTKQRQTS